MSRTTYWCPFGCGKSIRFDLNEHEYVCYRCFKAFNKQFLIDEGVMKVNKYVKQDVMRYG